MYISIIFIRSHLFCNVLLHWYTSVHTSTQIKQKKNRPHPKYNCQTKPNKTNIVFYIHICVNLLIASSLFIFLIMRWGCGDVLNNKYESHCTLPKIQKTKKKKCSGQLLTSTKHFFIFN